MEPIPKKGTPERQRLIDEHRRCVDSMKGVAGFSVLECRTPGDTTEVGGGIYIDPTLRRVLLRMRGERPRGKLVVICTKIEKEWRIGRLSGIRGVPPTFATDEIYTSEQEIQHAIFLMRLDELSESYGFPEDFDEGWKRRDDNWPAT
ncbi:N,N-dimethylformamidase, small subunit [Methylocella silvestris]|uniref:N,N-dimethylformamidase, small subunit n=1 Tax=Methylocella silvestris TaxID=199596 RepID=A0A2J7TDQ4_METSI|nr:N,N-dimethylformamidase, small subunit [Methylocella silvestris]PNG24879.1 N,N-dimethylformamidase, small subunit [Methylocella silvestris]